MIQLKRFILFTFCLIVYLPNVLLATPPNTHSQKNNKVVLTQKEKSFISQHKIIRKCVDPLWMPLEGIDTNGKHVGVIASILELIENKVGIKTQLVPTKDWLESMDKLKSRECDIVTSDAESEDSETFYRRSKPFLEIKNVYITRKSTPLQLDFSDIKHRTIGIPKGYPTIALIQKVYGNVNFVEVNNVDEGMLMVSRGELYAFTDLLAICSYSIEKQMLSNLKVAGHLDVSIPTTMAIRSDMPELLSIFNKALSTIDKSTISNLNAKWIKIEYDVTLDWETLIKYIALTILIIGVILYWVRRLYLLNCNLNKANAKLELLNETDSLSKMKNRNFVTFQLPLLIKLAHRNQHSLALAILDIDHFKNLNDNYGHDVGDKCIVAISQKIHTIFHREDDWIIRYGGDEFVVVSLDANKENFIDKLDLLREEVTSLNLDTKENIACSLSMGYIFHPHSPKKWHEGLIADADKKLYEAKESGRNTIVGN